jgi:1,2-beta-oligoglucan phosphorylase
MKTQTFSPTAYPAHIASPSGLHVEVNANGSTRRMDHRDIFLNLFLGNELEGGPTNIYLRRHGPEMAPLWSHVERALTVMAARVIPGTHLAAYGHGDWNDSLQPADPAMRERWSSAWTVTLHYQTLATLAKAMGRVGRPEPAAAFEASAARIREDFQRLLIVDETLAGFGYVHPDGHIDYLMHPRDRHTGIYYRLLPMIHALITDLLTPEQARTYIGYMQQYLLGSDGARLFDRPPP